MKNHSEDGYTIIEMMVIILIIAILGAMAYPNFEGVFNKNKLRGSTTSVTTSLYVARMKAINDGIKYGVEFFEDGTFQILKDPYGTSEAIGTPYSLDTSVTFGDINFTNRLAVFDEGGRLDKACLPADSFTGTIKITNGTIDSTSVEVTYLTGRIRETNK